MQETTVSGSSMSRAGAPLLAASWETSAKAVLCCQPVGKTRESTSTSPPPHILSKKEKKKGKVFFFSPFWWYLKLGGIQFFEARGGRALHEKGKQLAGARRQVAGNKQFARLQVLQPCLQLSAVRAVVKVIIHNVA